MQLDTRGRSCGQLRRWGALAAAVVLAVLGPVASRAFDSARVEPSVYKIYTFIAQPNKQYAVSSGSGFLISGRRYVMTNFHVIEGGEHIYIALRNGRELKMVEARPVERRPNVDLALLEAREDLPGEPLNLGEYEPEKLAEVIAIGFPGAANLNKDQGGALTDLDSTVTTGVVSRMTFTNLKVSETQTLSARTVQHNSAINPGNSGGPLFDACGNVVGINTLQGLNSQGLFFSIHAGEVARFLRELDIPFASTKRGCTGGASSLGIVPVAFGLTAALALAAAAFMFRTGRASAWLEAVPAKLAELARSRPGTASKGKVQRAAKLTPSGPAGALCLRPVAGGVPIRLDEGGRAVTIGRGPGADVTVASDTVSKVHARVAFDKAAERIRVTDLNSSNGTYLDGARIRQADAGSGASLRFGALEYTVARETRVEPAPPAGPGAGWMLSGFDPSGRALQFELRLDVDPASKRERPATWTFGRDPGRANFIIDDGSVSSLHAQLLYNPGEALTLRDLGSMNGTRLDGESIGTRSVALGDARHEIAFGLATLRLSRLSG